MPKRFDAVKAEARRLGINTIVNRPQKGEVVPMGFVASGVAYAYLRHALAELGLTGRIPILRLGLSLGLLIYVFSPMVTFPPDSQL